MEDMFRLAMHPVCHFYYSYLSNSIIRRYCSSIYDLINPVQILRHINRENNIDPVQNEILVIEGVEEENEGVESENEGVDNDDLNPDRKGCCLRNPTTINYNDGRANWWSMVWSNLIVGSYDLYNVSKAYANIFNAIITFVAPTPPTNIIINETILTQYNIK